MHEEILCCSRDPVYRDSSRGLYVSAFHTCNYNGTNNRTDGHSNNGPDRDHNHCADRECYTKYNGKRNTDTYSHATTIKDNHVHQGVDYYAEHVIIHTCWRENNLEEHGSVKAPWCCSC